MFLTLKMQLYWSAAPWIGMNAPPTSPWPDLTQLIGSQLKLTPKETSLPFAALQKSVTAAHHRDRLTRVKLACCYHWAKTTYPPLLFTVCAWVTVWNIFGFYKKGRKLNKSLAIKSTSNTSLNSKVKNKCSQANGTASDCTGSIWIEINRIKSGLHLIKLDQIDSR